MKFSDVVDLLLIAAIVFGVLTHNMMGVVVTGFFIVANALWRIERKP